MIPGVRVLDVSPRLVVPPENGSTYRMYHLMLGLAHHHEVRQFSQPRLRGLWRRRLAAEARPAPSYLEHCNRNLIDAVVAEVGLRSWVSQAVLSGASLHLTRPARLREWLRWADAVLVEFPWQFDFCRRHAPRAALVLAGHNLEVSARASSARAAGISVEHSRLLRRVARLEREAMAAADLVLAVSDADGRDYRRRYGVEERRVAVIPNGADVEGLRPLDPSGRRALRARLGLPEGAVALYMSGVPKIPDVEGLKWVRRVAARLPAVTFLVVGRVTRPAVEGNVVALGWVPDHRPWVRAADISLCPIEHGGGTKLKLLDGLAAGLPTVAFAESLHGTELRDGEHLLVAAKDEDAILGALRRLLDDPAAARALGSAGREFVAAHHDWKQIARRLEAALVELASRGVRPPGPGAGVAASSAP